MSQSITPELHQELHRPFCPSQFRGSVFHAGERLELAIREAYRERWPKSRPASAELRRSFRKAGVR